MDKKINKGGSVMSNKLVSAANKAGKPAAVPKNVSDNPPKFKNGGMSLEEAVRRNGGKLDHANIGILEDASW
jgi:hypothetical protein